VNEPRFLKGTAFDPKNPIKIVTHGWQSSEKSVAVQDIRKGLYVAFECCFSSQVCGKWMLLAGHRKVLLEDANAS